jgi:hypothetical protein
MLGACMVITSVMQMSASVFSAVMNSISRNVRGMMNSGKVA